MLPLEYDPQAATDHDAHIVHGYSPPENVFTTINFVITGLSHLPIVFKIYRTKDICVFIYISYSLIRSCDYYE